MRSGTSFLLPYRDGYTIRNVTNWCIFESWKFIVKTLCDDFL